MHKVLKVSISTILIIYLPLLASCSSKAADSKQVENFCNNIQIGASYEALQMSLQSLGLELRARAPEAAANISNLLDDPYSVDGGLVTSKGLAYPELIPACMVYFSSVLHRGDGKIAYKKFITSQPKGI
ncbi:MAG: hypothetical protein V4605_10585 [Pseudomonadota bacterium]